MFEAKHAKEFGKYVQNHQYDVIDDGGVLFPRACAVAHGGYLHDLNGQDERFDKNLLPDQALIYLLSVGYNNGTRAPTWYVALYAANYTPVPGITAASFPATASEITSITEGYAGAVRPLWVPTSPVTPMIDSLANRSQFNIVTASSLVINGAALLSVATKGAITGTLGSISKFAASRLAYNGDAFNIAYRVVLTSS